MDKYVYDWLADMKITFERIADSLEIIAEAKRDSVLNNIIVTEDGATFNYGYDSENKNLK